MVANVQTALATKVQDLSGVFRKKQTAYLKREKRNGIGSSFIGLSADRGWVLGVQS